MNTEELLKENNCLKEKISSLENELKSVKHKLNAYENKRKIAFRSLKEVKHSVKTIGHYLANAASAGIDVLSDAATDGSDSPSRIVVIAGNDNSGKTTLLYTAKFGEKFNRKLIVPTVGYNGEFIEFPNSERDTLSLEVYDLGGGSRMGPMFFKHMEDVEAIIYVIRVSDNRLVSALWELYILVKRAANNNPDIPVCILLVIDDHTSIETFGNNKYMKIKHLCEREALPPTRSKWESPNFNEYNDIIWDKDRLWVETNDRTSSHGMRIPDELPELSNIHKGKWIVMPLIATPELPISSEDALLPFEWVKDRLLELNPPSSERNIFDINLPSNFKPDLKNIHRIKVPVLPTISNVSLNTSNSYEKL